jgi:hypothetical protein
LRGPVRRSIVEASDTRQLRAAIARCAGVSATCISFSASAKVAGVTSGPTGGVAPKVGGAPAGAGGGVCAPAPRASASRPSGMPKIRRRR